MNPIFVTLQLQLLKEDQTFIVYAPALDLSGYGPTSEEALRDFHNAFKIFIEETTERGTLEKALLELGWQKVVKNNKPEWKPPYEIITSMQEKLAIPA